MPRIKQILKQMFLNAEILESINPEEVVAQGAATEVTSNNYCIVILMTCKCALCN